MKRTLSTLSLRLRSVIAGAVVASLAAAPALAVEPTAGQVQDSVLHNSKTVAVQPIFMAATRKSAWYDLGAQLQVAQVTPAAQAQAKGIDLSLPKTAGFSFAGEATAADMSILRYAMVLGMVPAMARAGMTEEVAKTTEALASQHSVILGSLSEAARLSAALLITVTRDEEAAQSVGIGQALGAALTAGMLGIAEAAAKDSATQRAHGYYTAGIWAGASLLIGMAGGSNEWSDMAEPIATLLDKDAAFGGADRQLATHLRAIAGAVREGNVNLDTVKQSLTAITKIAADRG